MMKYMTPTARILMGLLFLGSGISFFFMETPPLEGAMADFFNGLQASKYFFPLVKVTEIVCGLMLISGYFVPLALVILAPVIINIFFVHLFLAPEGLPLAIIIGLVQIYLAFFSAEYSAKIKSLFTMR